MQINLMSIGKMLCKIADDIEAKDWVSAYSHTESARYLIREMHECIAQKVKEVEE